MRTDKYITNQAQVIETKLSKIAELEALIVQLRKEIRNDSQLHQARQSANVELMAWLEAGKALMGDMAGIFPMEFLEDVKAEVADIADQVKDDYENFGMNSDRFLSGSDEEEEIGDETPTEPETIEVIEVVEVEVTEAEVVEDADEQEDDSPNHEALTATNLGNRLGFDGFREVSSNFKTMSREEFEAWSKELDPDGKAWYKTNGKYHVTTVAVTA